MRGQREEEGRGCLCCTPVTREDDDQSQSLFRTYAVQPTELVFKKSKSNDTAASSHLRTHAKKSDGAI